MKIKSLLTSASAFAMAVVMGAGMSGIQTFAADGEGTAETDVVYVTMNVPYADFYAAEGISEGQQEVDLVSTATTSKSTSTTGLAKGTYNSGVGEDGQAYILGVTYPVAMDKATYETLKAGLGDNTSADYYFTDYEGTPGAYKTLTYADGKYSFSAATGTIKDSSMLSLGEYTTTGSYGDYQFSIMGALTAGTINDEAATIYGVIATTSDGMNYAFYILNNMWIGTRVTNVEIAWSVIGGQGMKKAHGSGPAFFQYDMNGKTLTNIKLITDIGIYNVAADFKLDEYYTGEDKTTALIASDNTIAVTTPEAFQDVKVSVSYKSGRSSVYVAQDAEPVNGIVELTEAIDQETNGTYSVLITSSNYAPVTVTLKAPITAAQLTSLNELQIQGNAYVAADASLTTLAAHVEEAADLIADENASSDDASELIGELETLIAQAAETVKLEENAFAAVAGASGSREYQGLFAPTTFKDEYNDIWVKYCKKLVGKTNAAAAAAALKSTMSGENIGDDVTDEQKAMAQFNCEFQPDGDAKLTFINDNGVYKLSDGTNTYTYEYLGISYIGKSDDWASLYGEAYAGAYFPASVYKAVEEDAGNYQYVLLCGDTPEETYHIEFRYGNNINDLQKALTGSYAYWLGAGFPSEEDPEMVENVIKLFCEENGAAVQMIFGSVPQFTDVTGSTDKTAEDYCYYKAAVEWAAEEEITKGYTAEDGTVTFGVGKEITRAEVMIMLWRAAGEPTEDADGNAYGDARNYFSDVKAGVNSATNKAIAWGYKEGITKGYSNGTFGVKKSITRKDVMIMLWRAVNCPEASDSKTMTFKDVVGSYAETSATYQAINWAYTTGVANGYKSGANKGKFGVSLTCNREDLVVFLYRVIGE